MPLTFPLKELVYSEYRVALFNKVKAGSAAYSQQFHSVRASSRSCPWRALISCIFLLHRVSSVGGILDVQFTPMLFVAMGVDVISLCCHSRILLVFVPVAVCPAVCEALGLCW